MIGANQSFKGILLTTACLAALAAGPAFAASTTVPGGTTRTSSVGLSGTDTLSIDAGGSLIVSSGPGINWTGGGAGSNVAITNNGILRTTATTQVPVLVAGTFSGGALTLNNTGTIESTSTADTAPLLYFATLGSGTSVTITNSGTIKNLAANAVTLPASYPAGAISFNNNGVALSSANFTLNNSGAIIGSIFMGTGANTLNFTTGSSVSGVIQGAGANNATLNLSGTGTGFTYGSIEGSNPSNTFLGWSGIFNFNVNSGNWTMIGGGDYRNTTVAAGASLNICTNVANACATGRNTGKGAPSNSGIRVDGTDSVTIAATGTVTVTGGGSAIHWVDNATGAGITINNSGTLRTASTTPSPIILNDGDRTGTLTITNSGVIDSSSSANTAPLLYFATLGSGASVVVNNSGTIKNLAANAVTLPTPFPAGAISFNNNGVATSSAAFTLNNSGAIIGSVFMGTGANTLNFTTGSSVSGVILGAGADNATLNLSGTGNGFTYGSPEGPTSNTASFLGWGGIFNFNVNSGNWTMLGGGDYRNTVVAAGANLTICTNVANACATGRDTGKGSPSNSGIRVDGTDSVTIAAGATVTVTGGGTAIHWKDNATGAGITINNSGTLRTTSTTPSPLILNDSDRTGTLTITNSGVMDSNSSANTAPLLYFATLGSGASVVVNNSGTIRNGSAANAPVPGPFPTVAISFNNNGVALSSAAFTLNNSGAIIGSVALGSGANTLNFTTGSTISGPILGAGSNNATLNLSGTGSGFLYGMNEGANPSNSFLGWGGILNTNVNSGSWTLIGMTDNRNTVIAAGATLTVCAVTASCAAGRDTAHGNASLSGLRMDGADTLTVQAGATLATAGPSIATWGGNATGAGITITNAGTIRGASTATGSIVGNPATALITASVLTSGTNLQNITSGTLTVSNSGSMLSQTQIFNFNNLKAGANVVIDNSGTISTTTTTVTNSSIVNGVSTQTVFQSLSSAFSANLSTANFTITNSGTIHGNISLGSGTNILNLVTGSSLLGNVSTTHLTLNLSGAGTGFVMGKGEVTASGDSTFYGLNGAETVNVNSGDWTLIGAGAYGAVNIASGATFRVCTRTSGGCFAAYNGANGTPTDGGLAPLGTSLAVVNNGTLINDTDSTTIGGGSTATKTITGTGKFLQTGTGTSFLDAATTVQQKDIEIAGGKLVASAAIDGAVVIDAGATLQLGTGGTMTGKSGALLDNGTFGNVTGSIADNGTLVFNRTDDFTLSADLSGSGGIVKMNADTVTLTGNYTFTGTTQVLGGTVLVGGTLSSNSSLQVGSGTSVNLQGSSQTVAGLSDAPSGGGNGGGSSGGTSGATTPPASVDLGGGSLTVNQATDSSFSGSLTGSGTLTINGGATGGGTGDGNTLVLNGSSSGFTGTTNITGGTLQIGSSDAPTASLGGTVNITGGTLEVGDANAPGATLNGSVSVGSDGTLGGHGTITGSVTNAGTTAPGGSIGTLHVAGNYTFASGSLLEQEVAANGTADLLQADGTVTIANGTTVQVQPAGSAASYGRVTNYTIISGGSINGSFSGISSTVANLKPYLSYGAKGVNLALVRTDISLTTLAATANQTGVAAALNAGGGAIYDAVAPNADAAVRQGFDLASGELHASLASALLQNDGQLTDAVLRSPHGEGVTLWGMDGASWSRFDAGANTAAFRDNNLKLAGGIDLPLGDGVRIGLSSGYARDTVEALARGSSGRVTSFSLGGYIAAEDGPLSLIGGFDHAWHNIGSLRAIGFGSVSEGETANYDGTSLNLFARASYRLALDDGFYVAPAAAIRWSRLHTGAFAESGGLFALSAGARSSDAAFADIGAWLGRDFEITGGSLSTRLYAGWEGASGDLTPFDVMRLSNGGAFNVLGAPIGAGAAKLSAELGLHLKDGLGLTLAYDGRMASRSSEDAVSLHLGWQF